MKSLRYHIYLLVALVLSLTACADGDIRYSMADIDKVYIPAWIHLKQGNTTKALPHMQALEEEWFIMKEVELEDWETAYWSPAVREIDKLFGQALKAAEADNGWEAFVALDRIRYKLVRFRKMHYIDYYLDNIWDFQAAHTEFHEIANDDVLCWLTWEKMEEKTKDLNALWKKVKYNDPDPEIFYLDETALLRFHANRDAISNELINLENLVACADRENMALSSARIGLNLDELIKAFGYMEVVEPINEPELTEDLLGTIDK
jgi:hypothetical protein